MGLSFFGRRDPGEQIISGRLLGLAPVAGRALPHQL